MLSKLFSLLVAFTVATTFSYNVNLNDVICIHSDLGVVHLEKEHPELPKQEGEVHVKLISEVSLKFSKLMPGDLISPSVKLIPATSIPVAYKPARVSIKTPKQKLESITTIKLLI